MAPPQPVVQIHSTPGTDDDANLMQSQSDQEGNKSDGDEARIWLDLKGVQGTLSLQMLIWMNYPMMTLQWIAQWFSHMTNNFLAGRLLAPLSASSKGTTNMPYLFVIYAPNLLPPIGKFEGAYKGQ